MIDNQIVIAIPSEFEFRKIFHNHDISLVSDDNGFKVAKYRNYQILISGVSKINTTYILTRFFLSNRNIAKIYLVGIAGAYRDVGLEVGDTVSVGKDFLIDEAVLDGDNIITMYEKGLEIIPNNYVDFERVDIFPIVISNTVSLMHNDLEIATMYQKKYNASIENMEGAAFGFIANRFNIKTSQLRAVSNLCADRDRSSWNIKLACNNLRTAINILIDTEIS